MEHGHNLGPVLDVGNLGQQFIARRDSWGLEFFLPQGFCAKIIEVVTGQPIQKFEFCQIP